MRDPKQKKKSREAAAEQQEGSFWKQAALLSGLTAASVLTGLYVQNKRRLDAVEDEEEEEEEIHDSLSVEGAKEPISPIKGENKEISVSRYKQALQDEYEKQLREHPKIKDLTSDTSRKITLTPANISALQSSDSSNIAQLIKNIVMEKINSIQDVDNIQLL